MHQNQTIPEEKVKEYQTMFKFNNLNLSEDQKQSLLKVLFRHDAILSRSEFDLGKCDILQHVINTGNARPIKQNPYKTDPIRQEESKRQIEAMLKADIIEPSNAPWASPAFVVPKKNKA